LFGTEKQHKLWNHLGHGRAWLYLGMTIEVHIYDCLDKDRALETDELLMEIPILSDDKTAVLPLDYTEATLPRDVKEAFEKFGYHFKRFEDLTSEQKMELGFTS